MKLKVRKMAVQQAAMAESGHELPNTFTDLQKRCIFSQDRAFTCLEKGDYLPRISAADEMSDLPRTLFKSREKLPSMRLNAH